MRIVAPWYSPVLPNGVVDEKSAVEKALDFGGGQNVKSPDDDSHPGYARTGNGTEQES
jgi:hypothetical protein